jgi:thiol:disulfide interchange protein DsbC
MKIFISILFVLLLSGSASAEQVDKETEAKIRSSLSVMLPGLVPDEIRPTPVSNLFEVTFGGRIVYLTADGRYLLQGKIIDLETRTEITEERLSELKAAALAAIGEDQMVIFGPDDAKDTVTVFTDIDCGYCRKLHSEMARYNEEGIRIRYLFYPRAGIGSDSYKKSVSVWCADDRRAAMDQAKAGKEIPQLDCENPVEDHYHLGQTVGVTGTPALLLEGGEMVPGYVPAHKLRKALDARREQTGG